MADGEQLRHARSTVAAGTWSAPDAGVTYGRLVVDATALQLWSGQVERATGVAVDPEHAVVAAVGRALVAAPGLNRVIRLGRAAPRNGVAVTLVTRGIHRRIDDADALDVTALASTPIDDTDRAAWAQTDRTLRLVPPLLLRAVLRVVGLLGRMGIALPGVGISPGAAGAAIVERGAGFDQQYTPLIPYVATALHVTVGRITERVLAVGGAAAVRPTIALDITVDNRLAANDELDVLVDVLRATLSDPYTLGVVERPSATRTRRG